MAIEGTGLAAHPRGLSTLFFTEMWERLSYYGMRGLLILYMTAAVATGGLGWSAEHAGVVYGVYTAAVYFTAIPGGFVADRLLGTRRAVLVGGIVIALGHYCLLVSDISFFYAGLVLVAIGTGLLKPNAAALVGQLYTADDPRRDAGFSYYYMGINLGAVLAPIACSTLGEKVGWHWGFAAAGIGMTAGVVQFVIGQSRFGAAGLLDSPTRGRAGAWLALVSALALGAAVLWRFWAHADQIVLGAVALFFAWMLAKAAPGLERKRMGAILVLFVFSALFWGGFEQAGSSLNLFARDYTDRIVLGWEFPAGWFQLANPALVVILTPFFVWLWGRLGPREPSSPAKFAYGLLFVGLGFVVMAMAARVAGVPAARVSLVWLTATYVLHTIAELCLSPVGMSTVTKLAPPRLVGLMMGVWYLSLSLGNYAGGQVASQFEKLPLPHLFGAVAGTTIGAAIVLVLLVPTIKRLMGGVK